MNEKCVALSIRTTKLTGRILALAMKAYRDRRNKPNHKHGKQSIKSLAKQGASLDSVTISGRDIGSFKKIARKYNIDFALQKDSAVHPPNWIVFFKAKDDKSLDSAFKEFSTGILKNKGIKTPMLEKLNHFKEIANSVADPTKDRSRGEISL